MFVKAYNEAREYEGIDRLTPFVDVSTKFNYSQRTNNTSKKKSVTLMCN